MKKILFILILGISVWSCKKDCDPKPQPQKAFEVHGYLISRQDNNPKIGGHIKIMYERNNSFIGGCSIYKVAGEGYSDSTGYFAIDCNYYGYSGYIISGSTISPPPRRNSS